ncbi:MAG: MBL fold metallo-hydrolase, partial [Chloroflexi bacterium]|nr:MBL fold metallo-hydrolase [Chloroflexota bacterium]
MTTNIQKYETAAARRIYTFPVQAFSTLRANIYIISDGQHRILVDCGSGMEQSNQDLLHGLEAIGQTYGEPIHLADIDQIILTHGHIDHFGGLPFVRQFTQAPVGIHLLDLRVISHHEERMIVAARHLENYLVEAGVSDQYRVNLMQMYTFAKTFYRSTPIDFLLTEDEPLNGNIQVYHVPGHCPGLICLQIDDILLTTDHILSKTTPHQAPERITHNMGLGHYLDSLKKIEKLDGVRLGLGGHEKPMEDVRGRIQAIRQAHQERLNKVMDICHEPKSIADISKELFGSVSSY